MSALIVYRTRYGTAGKCAGLLRDRLSAECHLADLKREREPTIEPHDTVIIGGSIYGGTIQREVVSFCDNHREALVQRKVGLFLCCLYQGEKARHQIHATYPSWLVAHAAVMSSFGGEIEIAQLSLLDRLVVRNLFGYKHDMSLLDMGELERFAQALNASSP
jgi:menaquinone-dependent protoporphyrinogen oxidase